jgi:hypothetical protein
MNLVLLAYVELVYACHLWSTVNAMSVIQPTISELNTLTATCSAVKYGIKSGNKIKIKWNALSVANKFNIIKKVDTQLHVTKI